MKLLVWAELLHVHCLQHSLRHAEAKNRGEYLDGIKIDVLCGQNAGKNSLITLEKTKK